MIEPSTRRRRRSRQPEAVASATLPSRGASFGSAVWLGLLFMVAVVAALTAVDRAGRRNLWVATLLPENMRSFSVDLPARASLTAGHGDEGLAMARQQILRQPVPAESLSNFALAASLTNQPKLASRAIVMAAQRGWRDPLAQQTMVTAAIGSGEWKVALDRTLALQLATVSPESALSSLRDVLKHPKARFVLSRELVTNRQWRDHFLEWGAAAGEPDQFADTVVRALRAGARYPCVDLSDASGSLLRRGAALAAASVWTGPCATGSNVDPRSIAFTADSAANFGGPFAWTYPTPAGLVSTIKRDLGGWVLDYENSQALNAPVAERMMMLSPGPHMITARVAAGEVFPAGRITMMIWCVDAKGAIGSAQAITFSEAPAPIEIPAQGCMVQHLRLNGLGSVHGLTLSGT